MIKILKTDVRYNENTPRYRRMISKYLTSNKFTDSEIIKWQYIIMKPYIKIYTLYLLSPSCFVLYFSMYRNSSLRKFWGIFYHCNRTIINWKLLTMHFLGMHRKGGLLPFFITKTMTMATGPVMWFLSCSSKIRLWSTTKLTYPKIYDILGLAIERFRDGHWNFVYDNFFLVDDGGALKTASTVTPLTGWSHRET